MFYPWLSSEVVDGALIYRSAHDKDYALKIVTDPRSFTILNLVTGEETPINNVPHANRYTAMDMAEIVICGGDIDKTHINNCFRD